MESYYFKMLALSFECTLLEWKVEGMWRMQGTNSSVEQHKQYLLVLWNRSAILELNKESVWRMQSPNSSVEQDF